MQIIRIQNSIINAVYHPLGNNKSEGICAYDFNNAFGIKGYYKYKNYSSIRNENEYNLDFSSLSKNNQFYFYGTDYINYMYEYYYFISEEGSGIILYYESENDLLTSIKNLSK